MKQINEDFFTYKLKNKLSFWRIISIILIIILAFTIKNNNNQNISKPHIARIYINGELQSDLYFQDNIRQIKDNKNVKAVLLRINSPGGTSTSAEAMLKSFDEISKNIPIIASIDEIAASAAYIVALSANRIYAYNSSLTGSIGMLIQGMEFTEIADKIGVKFINIKSDKFKASPMPTEKFDEETKKYLENLVEEGGVYFKELVKERRKLSEENFKEISSAKIYSGRQGVTLGLIDEIGGESDAINWLNKEHKLDNLPIIDYSLAPEKTPLEMLFNMNNHSDNFIYFLLSYISKFNSK